MTARSVSTSKSVTPTGSTPEKPEIEVSASSKLQVNLDQGLDLITSGLNQVRISLVQKTRQEGPQTVGSSSAAPTKPMPRIRFIKSGQNSGKTSPETTNVADTALPAPPPSDVNGVHTPIMSPHGSIPTMSITTPVEEKSADYSVDSPDPLSLPLPSSPMTFSPANSLPSLRPETPDNFVQYQPEGPTPVAMPVTEPVKFLPPNLATPTPMKRSELPSFTATSAIPFARSDAESAEMKNGLPELKPESRRSSVWTIPETPFKG